MDKAVTAMMLRRVAEAADGIRTGEQVWFVVSYVFPHELLPNNDLWYFSSQAAAEAAVLRRGGEYGVFGPYKTPGPSVATVPVTVRGEKVADDVDLLVLSLPAFDKFVAPYYYQLWGPTHRAYDQVSAMRQELIDRGYLLHRWPTIMKDLLMT
jgi:hypothetical protein